MGIIKPIGFLNSTYITLKYRVGSPYLIFLYWTTNLRALMSWKDLAMIGENWLVLEKKECLQYSINEILVSPTDIASSLYNHNPVIQNAVFGNI